MNELTRETETEKEISYPGAALKRFAGPAEESSLARFCGAATKSLWLLVKFDCKIQTSTIGTFGTIGLLSLMRWPNFTLISSKRNQQKELSRILRHVDQKSS
jgi:hypothetical protein